MFRHTLRVLTTSLSRNLRPNRFTNNNCKNISFYLHSNSRLSGHAIFSKRTLMKFKPLKTEEEVKAIVMRCCKEFEKIPAEKVSLESRFVEDLGIDSLDHVELIMAIEDEMEFEVPIEESEKMKTPQDIINFFNNRNKNFTHVTI